MKQRAQTGKNDRRKKAPILQDRGFKNGSLKHQAQEGNNHDKEVIKGIIAVYLRKVKYSLPRKYNKDLRCYQDQPDKEGLFHCFSVDFEELDGGVGNFPVALIENEIGEIEAIDVKMIQFVESIPETVWKNGVSQVGLNPAHPGYEIEAR